NSVFFIVVPPCSGVAEPVLEAGRADARILAGRERAIVHLRTVVAGVDVGRYLAWVPLRAQESSRELVHSDWFGAGQLDRPMPRYPPGEGGGGGGDVPRGEGRHGRGGRAALLPLGARIGDPADELEELRRAHDRVGHRRRLDRLFLGDLRAHVAAAGY